MSTGSEITADQGAPGGAPRPASCLRTVILVALILVGAVVFAAVIFLTEPDAKRESATRRAAMAVDVVQVERGTYRPVIVATGTVAASEDIELRPQVSGRVVRVAEDFAPGGFLDAGQMIVRLEAADYHHTLALRESELLQALADLALEQGRSLAAEQEYAFLEKALPAEREALVLRRPQLEAAEEWVRAARAAVEQAELDLARTAVTVPYATHVLRRDVNVGSQVSPSTSLGRVVGLDTWWVLVDLPRDELQWIRVADGEARGSPVEIRNERAWPPGAGRQGHVLRLVAALDGATRLARVVVDVPDPLARSADGPALMVGEFVEVRIEGVPLEGVVRLHRDHLRKGDTVWVYADGELEVREVEVVLREADHAYVSAGLEGGEQVVTTHLSIVRDGAPLRLRSQGEDPTG